MHKMDAQLSKIVSLGLVVILVVVVVVFIFFIPGSDNGNVQYYHDEGKVVVTEKDPFSLGTWDADISYFDSKSDSHTVIEDHPVTISKDRLSITITDEALVNLENYTYDLRLYCGSEMKSYTFTVSDHEFSGSEMAVIIAVIAIVGIALVIAVAKRIVKGRW